MRYKILSTLAALILFVPLISFADHPDDEYIYFNEPDQAIAFNNIELVEGDIITLDIEGVNGFSSENIKINDVVHGIQKNRNLIDYEITQEHLEYDNLRLEMYSGGDGSVDTKLYHIYYNGDEIWNASQGVGEFSATPDNYNNGLLDSDHVYSNDLPELFYDNDLSESMDVANKEYLVEFNEPMDIRGYYINLENQLYNSMEFNFINGGSKTVRYQNEGPIDEYFKVDFKNIESIEIIFNSTGKSRVTELEFFGEVGEPEPLPDPLNEVENLFIEEGINSLTVNYDVPTDENFSHTNIYLNEELIGEGTTGEFVIQGLEPSTEYEIKVSTVRNEGVESEGKTLTAKTLEEPTTDINNLTAEIEYDRVDLYWDNPNIEGYEKSIIYRQDLTPETTATLFNTVVSAEEYEPIFETNGTEFSDLTVQEGQTYEYKVTAIVDGSETEGETIQTNSIPKVPIISDEVKTPFTANTFLGVVFDALFFIGPIILLTLAITFAPNLLKLIKRVVNDRKLKRGYERR
ncbi:hypothetical protein [Piscibacillus halophilus]|uniref:hypothetical protein n=1 Tax=Piscibacillus halophilus TaxID=571933 RepID=UPI001589B36C|nr:hypothetical protein [Piscibacillus halophilus]